MFADDVISHLISKGIPGCCVHGNYYQKNSLVLDVNGGEENLQIMEYCEPVKTFRLSWAMDYSKASKCCICAIDDEIEFDWNDDAFQRQNGNILSCNKEHVLSNTAALLANGMADSYPHIVIGKASKVTLSWVKKSIDYFIDCLLKNKISLESDTGELIETNREQLINARAGQGIFRKKLLAIEKSCRVTDLDIECHLRASHIKPWRVSSDAERLDGNNGLMLSPHIDHLFDQGYISFDNNGTILVSNCLDPDVLDKWGIGNATNNPFNIHQQGYLDYHRTHVLRKCKTNRTV